VKFDGYRIQLHKQGRALSLLSRSGKDMSDRFAAVIELARDLPARSLILDGELVACARHGAPDFYGLLLRRAKSPVSSRRCLARSMASSLGRGFFQGVFRPPLLPKALNPRPKLDVKTRADDTFRSIGARYHMLGADR
jgi:hypothetical protein